MCRDNEMKYRHQVQIHRELGSNQSSCTKLYYVMRKVT